jgi:NADPH-dependent 2,4-dienoyl-CoA reductase/sulfur reductase-like enzyme
MEHAYDYLIIGGGMTADAAAKAIRDNDAPARIGIVSNEGHAPYERPPLSKALWKGDKSVDAIDLGTVKSGAMLHLNRRVVSLDRGARSARDDHGDTYRYRRLLLATGATPRKLPFTGERVIHFRTLEDYLVLRRFALAGARIAVIGGGFIGSELAASLASNGCKVTMLFPGAAIGAGRFPLRLAEFLNAYYRERGVELRTGIKVSTGTADASGVELMADASALRFDAVVAGLGVTPNTALAEQAGLRTDNGIVVDDRLRSSAPDIFAAGDIANFHNAALDTRLRVEHENAAISMGHHAGRIMAGADEAYTTLPYFYSDLFDLGYEAVGLLDDRLDVVEQWTTPYSEGVIYYLDNGRVRGVLLWNVWGQVDAARALIAERSHYDAENVRGRLPTVT